MATEKDSVNAE